MKAIVFDSELSYRADHPRPEPRDGEALVRVLLAGICRTDIEITRGYMGFTGVPGHEFVGVVEAVSSDYDGLVGRRVVGEINVSCGTCATCRAGLRTHCPERSVLGILNRDGAMAEYLTLPLENLHLVPDEVADEEAVFTEPLAAAFQILQQTHVRPLDRVLVMGDGKLGLLVALVLAQSQADVLLLGRHSDKLAIAEAQGVQTARADNFHRGDFDVVVEATGRAEGFVDAMSFVRPRGKLVLKSTVAAGVPLNLAPLVINEVEVIGSRCGPFKPALRALQQRALDVAPLISAVYPAERALEAFAHAETRGTIKVLVDFRADAAAVDESAEA